MKACVLHAAHSLRIADVPTPTVTDGTALVRVRACAICGSDIHIVRGEHPRPLPFAMGHEAAGEVVEVGAGVKGLSPGDRITWWVSYGSMAEYALIRPADLSVGRIAPHVPDDQGATTQLLCAILRGLTPMGIVPGDRVLVLGLGGVGLLALQCARLAGAEVMGADLHDNRLRAAAALGAVACVNTARDSLGDAVRKTFGQLTGVIDAMADDLSPAQTTTAEALSLVGLRGRYLLLSLSAQPRCFVPQVVGDRGIRIIPAHLPFDEVRPLCQRACDLVAEGRISLMPLLTHHAPLDDAPRLFSMVMDHPEQVIKATVEC